MQSQGRFREPARAMATASLLYAAYVVSQCPCEVLAECQVSTFYAAAGLPILLVAFINANHIT